MFLTALADPNPVIFLESFLESRQMTAITGPVPEEMYQLSMGQASILREGEELTIIAIGPLIQLVLAAAKSLEKSDGISLEVIDPVCPQPLDIKRLASSIRKTRRLIIVDQAVTFGGVGAEIASQIVEQCFNHLQAPIVHLGAPFSPPPFSLGIPTKLAIDHRRSERVVGSIDLLTISPAAKGYENRWANGYQG